MARIRTIKPEFFTSEDIVQLSPLARLLYIALWCEADREGRLAWKLKTLKMRYLPADDCDIEALCSELVGGGLVVPYGDGLAFIPKFGLHQHLNPRESASSLPDPKTEATRERRVDDASARVDDASEGDFGARVSDASARVQTPCKHASVTRREEGKGREGDSADVTRQPRRSSKPSSESSSSAAWASYAKAYEQRYRTAPVRNAAVNGQFAHFVSRIPADEAPAVAAFYVEHGNALYVNAGHPVNLLLRDAESLRTQWVTGRRLGSGDGQSGFRGRDPSASPSRSADDAFRGVA